MKEEHRNSIISNHYVLMKSVDLKNNVLFHLLREVFSYLLIDEVLNFRDEQLSDEKLVEVLLAKGEETFEKFLALLEEESDKINLEEKKLDMNFTHNHIQSQNAGGDELMENTEDCHRSIKDSTVSHLLGSGFKEQVKIHVNPVQPIRCHTVCLIINNVNYGDLREYRNGADVDCKRLIALCRKLNFCFHDMKDLTAEGIMILLRNFATNEDHASADRCFIFIMGHGTLGQVYGVDNEAVYEENIIKLFNNENCPKFKGKLKAFIFVSCRGSRRDGGVCGTDPETRMPTYTDIVKVHANVAGHINNRDPITGSWFIQEFVGNFVENYFKKDLATLLEDTASDVQNRISRDGEMQSIEVTNIGVTKKFYSCM